MLKTSGGLSFVAGMAAALAVGWLVFPRALYRRIPQPVQFSHKLHTGEKVGMGCADCHTLDDDNRYSIIPRIEQCSSCHSQVQGNTPDEKTVVDRYVTPNREIPWLVYARQPENVHFSHAQHVKLGRLQCERCHGNHGSTDSLRPFEENRLSGYSRDIWGRSMARIRNRSWEGMKMDDCSRCHLQHRVATGCLDCHK